MEEGYTCKACGLGKVYFYQRCEYSNGVTKVLYSFAECEACKDITDIPQELEDQAR